LGIGFSNVIAPAIVMTAAATLCVAGAKNVENSADAASTGPWPSRRAD
jgi:hypothetical protein